jgi:SAM-dependent methyltransferase
VKAEKYKPHEGCEMIYDSPPEQFITANCKICNKADGNKIHVAKEMLLGLRTKFHYSECVSCGSLQLLDPPEDFGPYYPESYYSYADPTLPSGLKNAIVQRLQAARDLTYFGEGSWFGRILSRRYDNSALRATLALKINRTSRILDVGCGSGKLLLRLHSIGFANLTGIDPFISHDINYRDQVHIRKCLLTELKDEMWDVIMFHHSLEHFNEPEATLSLVHRMLPERGQCLLRLPVVSWAWEHYGTSWRGVDPPRHIWLPTEKGVGILASSCGFRVTHVEYDSSTDQFSLSELYSRDHAYTEACSHELSIGRFFTRRELAKFRKTTKELNKRGCGDTAAFILEKF